MSKEGASKYPQAMDVVYSPLFFISFCPIQREKPSRGRTRFRLSKERSPPWTKKVEYPLRRGSEEYRKSVLNLSGTKAEFCQHGREIPGNITFKYPFGAFGGPERALKIFWEITIPFGSIKRNLNLGCRQRPSGNQGRFGPGGGLFGGLIKGFPGIF